MIWRLRGRLTLALRTPIKTLVIGILRRLTAGVLAPLIARLDRIEQNFALEVQRSRYESAATQFDHAVKLEEIESRFRMLVERRYGSLADRLRVVQQQGDLEKVRSAELQQKSLGNSSQWRSIAADVAGIHARLRSTPFMTGPIFPAAPSTTDRDSDDFDYVGFEDIFRGTEEMIQERQRAYLQFINAGKRVVDLGCGRGEFLALASSVDADVVGVDSSAAMVARCHLRGFNVVNVDALTFLEATEPHSVDVIFSAQFIEHLQPESLYDLFRLAQRALVPGGTFIAETVNPQSIEAMRTFYVDLTHVKPLFPEVLAFFARSAGFTSGRIFYPNGSGFHEQSPWDYGEFAIIATTRHADFEREEPSSPRPLLPNHPPSK